MQEQEAVAQRPIVVGVDGSTGSHEAVRWAAGLAGSLGCEVVAVHAVGLLDERHEPGTTSADRLAELRATAEHDWCAPLAAAGCRHRVELTDGHPVDVLLRAADRTGAPLVVMGSRGVGGVTARALGSTSLKLLQVAHLPVLVVPEPAGGQAPGGAIAVRTILVGVDRSAPALAALDLAAGLAAALGASLVVADVLEFVASFPLGPSTTVSSAGEEGAVERATALLDDDARSARARGVEVRVIVRPGDPAATLLALADEVEADLLVVGTRGRGGPDELLLGSVARTVADRARQPTLVVPVARAGPRSAPAG